MDTQKDVGASGWLIGFALATLDDVKRRALVEHERVCRSSGTWRTQRAERLRASLHEMDVNHDHNVVDTAQKLGFDGDPCCECCECISTRFSLARHLLSYWSRQKKDVLLTSSSL